ncbi:hypothetical protein ACFYTS_07260 [Nocardia sp. NPDC004151]|uniref:hypothetical protein n=1 Tax=Nocardia sp. NPDC004151 TaxID=3364304 RepID=UPI00367FE291
MVSSTVLALFCHRQLRESGTPGLSSFVLEAVFRPAAEIAASDRPHGFQRAGGVDSGIGVGAFEAVSTSGPAGAVRLGVAAPTVAFAVVTVTLGDGRSTTVASSQPASSRAEHETRTPMTEVLADIQETLSDSVAFMSAVAITAIATAIPAAMTKTRP